METKGTISRILISYGKKETNYSHTQYTSRLNYFCASEKLNKFWKLNFTFQCYYKHIMKCKKQPIY